MSGIYIKTDLKVMDYARENSHELSELMKDNNVVNDKIIIYNRDWTAGKYIKMSEMTLDDLKNLSVDLYPKSFYKEDNDNSADYGRFILLLSSKPWSLIQKIIDYASENWIDIKDSIIHSNSSIFSEGNDITWLSPYAITWTCENRDDGLTTYNVFLDGVSVGNFID